MFEQMDTMQWVVVILGLLLLISESLPFSEKIKSNGIFQGFINIMKAVKDFLTKKE